MGVYVDDMKAPYGRMIMCHMVADTLGELHNMADTIGVDRKHFQPKSMPHYDICQSKRKIAIENGAIEVTQREVVKIMRRNGMSPLSHLYEK